MRNRDTFVGNETRHVKKCTEGSSPMMLIRDVNKLCDMLIKSRSEDNLQDSFRNLLFHLNFNNGCTQLALANLTHLKAPTVSVTLQKMEKEGYVTRQPNAEDLRQTLVFITDKGKEYNERIYSTVKSIDTEIFSGISDEDQKKICDVLGKVIDNLISDLDSQKESDQ